MNKTIRFYSQALHGRSSSQPSSRRRSGTSITENTPRVYSLPDCKKCEELKNWLKNKNIEYEAKWFDSETQTEFVMRNMFGNPPVLEIGSRCLASEEMFPDGKLNEDIVREMLNVKEG
jgi:glutaredoxin